MNNIQITLEREHLVASPLMAWLANDAHGAQLTFFGVVRNHNDGKKNVTGITFDMHPTLAEKALQQIATEAIAQCAEKTTRIYIAHAQGYVTLGGLCIAIGVTSAHRNEAYTASRFIIEAVKTRAPIWKQEHYDNETSTWLAGHALNAS
ncbi:MAG: molybdenum cofactor biosynthesis protein MoaE [Endozoicomonadaceae bacterium]|nr:molybdenum cofactor biosynthesis protein MoaE [Endozoicomonadaceae bacterium]